MQELALELAAKIQRDIVPSQIIAALSVAGVYGVTLTSPMLTPLTAGPVGELHDGLADDRVQHGA